MTVAELTKEINRKCDDLTQAANAISILPPVTYLSKVQWTGGLTGAIQEHREAKRLEKLINIPIYKEWTFCTFAFHIIKEVSELVEMQLQVQKMTNIEDKVYYENVNLIVSTALFVKKVWFQYSVDMAMAPLKIGEENNVSLGPSVEEYVNDDIKKMDLPDNLRYIFEHVGEESTKSGSGCLGVFLLILVIPILIIGAVVVIVM